MKANADTIAELDALLAMVRDAPPMNKAERIAMMCVCVRDAYTASKED